MGGWTGPSSSVPRLQVPRVDSKRGCLQDLDLETASPMSPARPATPRAMPPTMAMPTSPSERKGRHTQSCPYHTALHRRGTGPPESGGRDPWRAGGLSPFFMALSMRRSSSFAWLFWGSVCSSPRTYFRAFSYSCSQGTSDTAHTPAPTQLSSSGPGLILPLPCHSPTPQSRVHKPSSCGG